MEFLPTGTKYSGSNIGNSNKMGSSGFFSRQGPQGAELPVGYLVGFSCSGYFVQQAPTLVDALTFDIHGLIS